MTTKTQTKPEPPQWQQWRDMRAEMDRRYEAATPIMQKNEAAK